MMHSVYNVKTVRTSWHDMCRHEKCIKNCGRKLDTRHCYLENNINDIGYEQLQ